jgi:D-tyrosyl-tRNA(Tyr) deacylase
VRLVVQRVSKAGVEVDGQEVASIGRGLLILVGVGKSDTPDTAAHLAGKVARLRVFPDDEEKMNRSVVDVGGEVLCVSQFTLYGNVKKGNRPSFIDAADPDVAESLIDDFTRELAASGVTVREGVFGGRMKVGLVNEGPVTILLEA